MTELAPHPTADQDWLEHLCQRNCPQLTVRGVVCGMRAGALVMRELLHK